MDKIILFNIHWLYSYVLQSITSRELQCAYTPMTSYYLQILCRRNFSRCESVSDGGSQIVLSPTRSRYFKRLSFTREEYKARPKRSTSRCKEIRVESFLACNIKRYQAAHQTITQRSRSRIIVTSITSQLAQLLYVTLILSKLDYASILTTPDSIERSERLRIDMKFCNTILDIGVQPHHVLNLREMFLHRGSTLETTTFMSGAFQETSRGGAERGSGK